MQKYPVHACTDITGFGLLGHIAEMVEGLALGVKIYSHKLPIIPETKVYAQMGLIPAGAYKNQEYRGTMVEISSTVDRALQDILFDPQTSGGLLICVDDGFAEAMLSDLKSNGIDGSTIVGEVVSKPKGKVTVV
jgi:selenide,water dikinase